MTPDLLIQLEIKRPDGAREDLIIEATRVIIGSGAHCDVRVTGEGAGREHVVLELRGQTIFAIAKHLSPPASSGGRPLLVETALADGDDVSLAGTRVRVRVVAAVARAAKRKMKRLVSVVLLALTMMALPGVVYAALRQQAEPPIGPPPGEVAALFEKPSTTCPVAAPDQALVLATRQRSSARVLREQHPFASADGLASVVTFEQSSACFLVASRAPEAAETARAAEALRREMSNEYLVHRVRLEHALDIDDLVTATREVKILRRLTAGRRGAYIDWLGMVERHLEPLAKG